MSTQEKCCSFILLFGESSIGSFFFMIMAAVGGNNIVWYTYTGADDERISLEATHITVAESCTFVRSYAFYEHENIVEVIFHVGVKKIEEWAFCSCPNLRRVIMPGVKIVESCAFGGCKALTDVECGKLEIIGDSAFQFCESLRGINLPSVRIVGEMAFENCKALIDVKFGNKLERIEGDAFAFCTSLERITIPLKDSIITTDITFQACDNLRYVDLVERELETIAAIQLEHWRNDMIEEIESINQILPSARAGYFNVENIENDYGEKAQVIRRWIRSVLGKIIPYEVEHQRILNVAENTLQLALPSDIVTNNVLTFLELPSHTFEVNDYEAMEERDSDHEEEDTGHHLFYASIGLLLVVVFSLVRGISFASLYNIVTSVKNSLEYLQLSEVEL